jgi:hypothetical protein
VKHARELRRGLDEVREVGLAVVGERRGNADDHRLAGGQCAVRVRGRKALGDPAQAVGRDVLDIGLAAPQTLDAPGVGVDANDVATRLRECERQGEPHVAEADDPYLHAGSV